MSLPAWIIFSISLFCLSVGTGVRQVKDAPFVTLMFSFFPIINIVMVILFIVMRVTKGGCE